jgi:DivIVA domain-containing protein
MPDQSSAATEHAILQEITRPLEALPDDPLSVVNADFPTALRGYDRVAVDEYVRRTRQLVAELQATRSPESAVRRALERVGEEITGILQRAHETAEQITMQSRSEAEDRLEQARQEAAQVADTAQQRVRELDADTDRIWLERQRIVADAEELAAQLLALAKTASERFPADGGAEAPARDYDEDHGETRGQEASFAAGDEDEAYYEDLAYRDAELERAEDVEDEADDDVEETLPFQPLKPSEGGSAEDDGTAERGPAGEEATAERGPAGDEATAERGPAGEEATAERGPAGDEATAERGSAEDPTGDGHPTSDDTTAVIPPASQAASRRRSR